MVTLKRPKEMHAAARARGNPAWQPKPMAYTGNLLALQRAIGNQAFGGFLQAKRTVNQPNDKYEQEADRVVEAVIRMPSTSAQLQRKCACGTTAERAEEGEEHRKKQLGFRKASAHVALSTAPPIVHEVLRSSGQPLDPDTRSLMESRLGYDFSQVRIHTDAKAAASARAVHARAYTVGQQVMFGPGQYTLGTAAGKKLLAHELTHVVQQNALHSPSFLKYDPATRLYADANRRISPAEANAQPLEVKHHISASLQKWDSPEHVELGEAAGGPGSGLIVLDCHDRDFPQRQQPISTWPTSWQQLHARGTQEQKRAITQGLTYGEIVALSGDFYEDFAALNRAPLREIYDLIPLIRSGATTSQLQAATGGRYLALAARNESHFSNVRPGHSNLATWRDMHSQAIQSARQGNANMAWGINAAADHFLTDAFSGGHIRTPRSTLMGSALGNVESKILHDLDNEHGVEVTNRRGDPPWIAYGDDMLADPRNARNRQLALEAVRLSKQDISDALSQGHAYPAPDAQTVFRAELLVPYPVDPSRDRWTGRVPTYVSGPRGMPIRVPDDYTRTRGRIIRQEAPGIAAGLFNDDDQIRDWVNRHDLAAIGRQPAGEKIRMIDTLLNGWISDEDVAAIERICSSVTSRAEMTTIRDAITPRLTSMSSLGQRMRVRIAINRTP